MGSELQQDNTDAKGPVTIRELAAGIRDEFTQWDRGVVGTFLALAWRPDQVVRGYVIDRDVRYAKPWRYLLFSVLANVTATWLVLDQFNWRAEVGSRELQQTSFLLEHAALLTIVTLPIIALAMRVAFTGLKYRLVDCLVMLCYTQGQVNLFGIVALAGVSFAEAELVNGALSVLILIYLLWAWASFARGPWWWRYLAAAVTIVAGQAINALVVLAVLRIQT